MLSKSLMLLLNIIKFTTVHKNGLNLAKTANKAEGPRKPGPKAQELEVGPHSSRYLQVIANRKVIIRAVKILNFLKYCLPYRPCNE